jgi:hypothetical protein
MVGMTCLTVRSGVTVKVRSARMPTLMISRASINGAPHRNVVPANAGTHTA